LLAADSLRDLVNLTLFLTFPGVILLSWITGRLLGVRRSWGTTVAAALLGWGGGLAISFAIANDRADPAKGFTRNVFLFSALGVMSASVWLELLARPGALARAQSGFTTIPRPPRSRESRCATASGPGSASAGTTRSRTTAGCRWRAAFATHSKRAVGCS
jgi:hypothetical protein